MSKKGTLMTIKYTKNENGDFVCPDCGVIKKRQNSMHYHMKKHMEELNHVCKVCKKGFLQKQTLDLHMKSKHSELIKDSEKKFTCPFDGCEFAALTKGNCIIHCLRVHCQEEIKEIMETNQETKTISCTSCEKTFSSSCGFYYHAKGCLIFKDENKLDVFQEIL
jgi:hypothetical protein